MIYGGVEDELINLNDDTLYSGEPQSRNLALDVTPDFDKVIEMLRGGKYFEADEYVTRHWLGRGQNSYQPLGDLHLSFAPAGPVAGSRCVRCWEIAAKFAVAKRRLNFRLGRAPFTSSIPT